MEHDVILNCCIGRYYNIHSTAGRKKTPALGGRSQLTSPMILLFIKQDLVPEVNDSVSCILTVSRVRMFGSDPLLSFFIQLLRVTTEDPTVSPRFTSCLTCVHLAIVRALIDSLTLPERVAPCTMMKTLMSFSVTSHHCFFLSFPSLSLTESMCPRPPRQSPCGFRRGLWGFVLPMRRAD